MVKPNWDLIRQQYDQMVKYATALRLGTAETEAILKRFSKNPFKHPTYLALMELGRVIKTIFLCQYLDSETVRREINEGLNVVERWNGVNEFIFYGKVNDLYFLSLKPKNGIKNHKFFEAALRRTNLLFPPTRTSTPGRCRRLDGD
jgi:TnpA family transposase